MCIYKYGRLYISLTYCYTTITYENGQVSALYVVTPKQNTDYIRKTVFHSVITNSQSAIIE